MNMNHPGFLARVEVVYEKQYALNESGEVLTPDDFRLDDR